MPQMSLWEFEGDTSSVVSSVEEAAASVDALLESISAAAEATGELDGLDAAFAGVTEAADLAAEAANSMAEASNAMLDVAGEGIDIEDELAAALQQVQEAADGARAAADQNAAALESMGVAAQGAADDETAAGDAANGASGGFLLLAMAIGQAITSFVGAGISAQNSLTTIAALTGSSQQQMSQYTDGLEQMSNQLGVTLTNAANGMYYVASAGFTGSQGLSVLKYAMEQAKAGGIDVSVTADGLTSALNAYGASAKDAGHYSDVMVTAVSQGKQTFQDFANSIGVAAVTGNTVGISFDQVAAAEATMTQSGLDAHRAVQDLDFLMRSIALSTDAEADKANKLGLSFDKSKYSSLDLMGKLQYLQQISGGNEAAFEKLVGGANGLSAAQILLTNNGAAYTSILDKMKNSQGATQQAFETSEQSISSHMDHLGATFSVLAYKAVQIATPFITQGIDLLGKAIGGLSDWVTNHLQLAIPILAGLAVVIGGVLVAAILSLLAPLGAAIAAAGPVIAIVAAVVAALAGLGIWIKHLWDTSAGFRTAIEDVGHAFQHALTFITPLWDSLKSVGVQIFNQVSNVVKTELIPAWNQIQSAIKPAIPLFQFLGMVLGFIVVTAIGLLIGALNGIIKAIGPIIGGIAQVVGGIVQVFAGGVQLILAIFGGLFNVINDLVHGRFGKIGDDFKQMWNGIVKGVEGIVGGFVNVVVGLFKGLVGGVIGFVSGLVGGVIGFFQHLFEKLVGHSIVTDLISGIINLFTGLPMAVLAAVGRLVLGVITWALRMEQLVLAAVRAMVDRFLNFIIGLAKDVLDRASKFLNDLIVWAYTMEVRVLAAVKLMVDTFLNFIEGLAGDVLDRVEKMVGGFVGKIIDMKDRVVDKVKDVTGGIIDEISKLPDQLLHWGEEMISQLVQGIKNKVGDVANAVKNVASTVANFLHFSRPDEGPLATAPEWMEHFGDMLSVGINGQVQKVKDAARNLASAAAGSSPLAASGGGPQLQAGLGGLGGQNQAMMGIFQQMLRAMQQGNQAPRIGPAPMPAGVGSISQSFGININAQNTSALDLYREFTILAGQAQENALRGALVGLPF